MCKKFEIILFTELELDNFLNKLDESERNLREAREILYERYSSKPVKEKGDTK
jgi:hypothetical protein